MELGLIARSAYANSRKRRQTRGAEDAFRLSLRGGRGDYVPSPPWAELHRRRAREDLNYRVIEAEQGKPVLLPSGAGSRKATHSGAGRRGESKRRPLGNKADTGCVPLGTTSPDAKAG